MQLQSGVLSSYSTSTIVHEQTDHKTTANSPSVVYTMVVILEPPVAGAEPYPCVPVGTPVPTLRWL